MHHKKLQVQDSASRLCSKASLIAGYIIIVTTQGGMRCLIILFCSSFCPQELLSSSETDGDGSVSVFGITLQFTILVAWSPPMSESPSSGKVNIIVQEKSISQIWLDQPAA